MVTIQKYCRVQSLEEAYELNQSKANRILGGMLWIRTGNGSIGTAIDLSDLGLDKIIETEDSFQIDAMVSLRMLETHAGLNQYTCDAVKKAVQDIVGVQFRNMATIGGSIWGRFGFSDVLTVFLAMDSYVELYKGGIIPLHEFATKMPDNDILLRLIIKKHPGKFAYRATRIQRTDFPVLTCATSCINNSYQVVVGARPNKAILISDENGYLANGLDNQSIEAFAKYAANTVPTGSNNRGSSSYRSHLVSVLVKRNLLELGGLA